MRKLSWVLMLLAGCVGPATPVELPVVTVEATIDVSCGGCDTTGWEDRPHCGFDLDSVPAEGEFSARSSFAAGSLRGVVVINRTVRNGGSENPLEQYRQLLTSWPAPVTATVGWETLYTVSNDGGVQLADGGLSIGDPVEAHYERALSDGGVTLVVERHSIGAPQTRTVQVTDVSGDPLSSCCASVGAGTLTSVGLSLLALSLWRRRRFH